MQNYMREQNLEEAVVFYANTTWNKQAWKRKQTKHFYIGNNWYSTTSVLSFILSAYFHVSQKRDLPFCMWIGKIRTIVKVNTYF